MPRDTSGGSETVGKGGPVTETTSRADALMATAALSLILMEERPLAGPATPAAMAE